MPKRKLANPIQPFPPLRIRYKDVFDLKAFYESLHHWLQEYSWVDEEDKTDHWETNYSERITTGNVREIWMWWRLTKPAPGSEYFHYYLDIDFHVLGLSSTEIVREGKKIKTDKGEVEMNIVAYIEPRYMKEFDKNVILREFKDLFTKRIYRQTIEDRKRELYHEIYTLQNFIKQWFKLKRYLPYEEVHSFYPSSAYPSHLK